MSPLDGEVCEVGNSIDLIFLCLRRERTSDSEGLESSEDNVEGDRRFPGQGPTKSWVVVVPPFSTKFLGTGMSTISDSGWVQTLGPE